MKIDGREIAKDQPPYIIAEMSGNHKGDIKRAFEIIAKAKAAGADAVKLQTYTPDTITIDHAGKGFVLKGGLWAGKSLYELYSEAMTPWDWHEDLFKYAYEQEITIFSSPFDRSAVDLLEKLNAPAYKIASFEIIDIPLIKYVAQTKKPLIISTGLANEDEIAEAVEAVGDTPLVLLHCVSGYPSPCADMNLATMADMAKKFGVTTGLSDHSLGLSVPVAATALGACVIEKHMTLSRADGGVDSDFSLEASEFAEMVTACHDAFAAIGRVNYDVKESEAGGRDYRRSLYVVADIRVGEKLSPDNVRSIRPGFGMLPKYYPEVLGRIANKNLKKGDALSWDMLEDE
jgi:N-acetylneuraminate synthase